MPARRIACKEDHTAISLFSSLSLSFLSSHIRYLILYNIIISPRPSTYFLFYYLFYHLSIFYYFYFNRYLFHLIYIPYSLSLISYTYSLSSSLFSFLKFYYLSIQYPYITYIHSYLISFIDPPHIVGFRYLF